MDTTLPTFNAAPPGAGNTTLSAISYTTANIAGAVAFKFEAYVTFRSTTSAYTSSLLCNSDVKRISNVAVVATVGNGTTVQPVTVSTTSQFYLGVSYVTGNVNNTTTFQECIVERVR